jgi:sialate O-acetylesterase
MAVTLDIGEAGDAHPNNKVHVGSRLALVARGQVYNEDLICCGPVYRSHEIAESTVRVKFDHAADGLVIGQAPWRADSMPEVPTGTLAGFSVADTDGRWFEAEARIEGDVVVVSSPHVPAPQAVAYGWADAPTVNLQNSRGLPAAPFRTDRMREP